MTIPTDNLLIDVAIQDPEWEDLKGIETLALETVHMAMQMVDLPEPLQGRAMEISVALANDDLIRILNREYREKNSPTNVLTFATLDEGELQSEDPVNLGDIVLSYQTVRRESQEQEKFLQDHVAHLLVHGTLHLLGYRHQDDDEANIMETLEIRILEKLGVQNPYTETIPLS